MFEIQEVQLRAASGQARCSCCNNIFNARKQLKRTEPEDRPLQETEQPQNGDGAVSLNGLFEEIDQEEVDYPELYGGRPKAGAEGEKSANIDSANTADAKSKKPSPDSETPEPDGKSLSFTDRRSFSATPEQQANDSATPKPFTSESTEEALQQTLLQPVDIKDDVSDEGLMPDSITLTGHNHSTGQGGRPLLWSVAILCLLTTALAQIVWFSRDNLKSYPEVRELLEFVCTQAGCALPPWHEPERFNISSRSVRTHPKNKRALQIQLVFNNTARFAQPFPQLQLRLYDANDKLSAQRVFRPEEYLAEAEIKTTLIMPDQSVEVDMALADPGTDVTGFKIEFL